MRATRVAAMVLGAVLASTAANAQMPGQPPQGQSNPHAKVCKPWGEMGRYLWDNYEEATAAIGMAGSPQAIAQGAFSTLRLLTSKEPQGELGKTFTVLMTDPRGISCLELIGYMWTDIREPQVAEDGSITDKVLPTDITAPAAAVNDIADTVAPTSSPPQQVLVQRAPCSDYHNIMSQLEERHHETVVGAGLSAPMSTDGAPPPWSAVMLTRSDDGGFSLVVTVPSGKTCLVRAGSNLRFVEKKDRQPPLVPASF